MSWKTMFSDEHQIGHSAKRDQIKFVLCFLYYRIGVTIWFSPLPQSALWHTVQGCFLRRVDDNLSFFDQSVSEPKLKCSPLGHLGGQIILCALMCSSVSYCYLDRPLLLFNGLRKRKCIILYLTYAIYLCYITQNWSILWKELDCDDTAPNDINKRKNH